MRALHGEQYGALGVGPPHFLHGFGAIVFYFPGGELVSVWGGLVAAPLYRGAPRPVDRARRAPFWCAVRPA